MKRAKTVMVTSVLLLMMFSIIMSVRSDSSTLSSNPGWTQTYGGTRDDLAFTLVQTTDGGYALAGYTLSYTHGNTGLADFYVAKTDSSGNIQWNRTYGGFHDEIVNSIVQTDDAGYALTGYSSSFSNTDDAYLVKTDSSGIMQWGRTFGGTGFEFANSGIQTSDGGYALAGMTDSYGAGEYDFYLIKTDSLGYMQWSRTYGGTGNDEAYSIVQTPDGGYALAGYTHSFGAGDSDFWLVKTDALGNMVWNRTYGGSYSEEARSVVQTLDGGYALAGEIYYAGGSSFYLVKTSGSGTLQWNKTFGGSDYASACSIVQTEDAGYAIAGHKRYAGVDSKDVWLVKTDSLGNMQLNKTYGGTEDDCAWSVVQTSDGGYALAGYTNSFGVGGYDFYLIKTDSLGNDHDPFHDVSVRAVHPFRTVVGKPSVCGLNVTVVNFGDFNEVLNLTAWVTADPPPTSILNISIMELSPLEMRTVTFFWFTADWAYGNYTVTAAVSVGLGETETGNNVGISRYITVTILGDVIFDGAVNVLDLIRIAAHLGHQISDYFTYSLDWYNFNNCDLSNDCRINVLDLIACASHLGQHLP